MVGTKRTTAKESESEYLQQQITNTVDNSHRQKTNLFTCVCSLGMFGRATIISDALMNPKYQFLVKEQSRQTLPKHDTNPRNSINQICPKQKTAWQVLWLWWLNQSSTFRREPGCSNRYKSTNHGKGTDNLLPQNAKPHFWRMRPSPALLWWSCNTVKPRIGQWLPRPTQDHWRSSREQVGYQQT